MAFFAFPSMDCRCSIKNDANFIQLKVFECCLEIFCRCPAAHRWACIPAMRVPSLLYMCWWKLWQRESAGSFYVCNILSSLLGSENPVQGLFPQKAPVVLEFSCWTCWTKAVFSGIRSLANLNSSTVQHAKWGWHDICSCNQFWLNLLTETALGSRVLSSNSMFWKWLMEFCHQDPSCYECMLSAHKVAAHKFSLNWLQTSRRGKPFFLGFSHQPHSSIFIVSSSMWVVDRAPVEQQLVLHAQYVQHLSGRAVLVLSKVHSSQGDPACKQPSCIKSNSEPPCCSRQHVHHYQS